MEENEPTLVRAGVHGVPDPHLPTRPRLRPVQHLHRWGPGTHPLLPQPLPLNSALLEGRVCSKWDGVPGLRGGLEDVGVPLHGPQHLAGCSAHSWGLVTVHRSVAASSGRRANPQGD